MQDNNVRLANLERLVFYSAVCFLAVQLLLWLVKHLPNGKDGIVMVLWVLGWFISVGSMGLSLIAAGGVAGQIMSNASEPFLEKLQNRKVLVTITTSLSLLAMIIVGIVFYAGTLEYLTGMLALATGLVTGNVRLWKNMSPKSRQGAG